MIGGSPARAETAERMLCKSCRSHCCSGDVIAPGMRTPAAPTGGGRVWSQTQTLPAMTPWLKRSSRPILPTTYSLPVCAGAPKVKNFARSKEPWNISGLYDAQIRCECLLWVVRRHLHQTKCCHQTKCFHYVRAA